MEGFAESKSMATPAKEAALESKRAKEKEKILEQKLDRILANQERILKRFDEITEELRIIKVRATR